MDDSRLTKKIFKWDISEHSISNKSNFCAQVKQVLCEIGLRDSYRGTKAVDINSGREKIMEQEKADLAQNVKG